MKRANGMGTITKLSGNRRKPYAVKITLGYTIEGKLRYKYLSYHRTKREAEHALAIYNQDPYALSKYTFKELYEEFYAMQEQQNKARTTLSNHRTAFKHLEPLWDMKIQNIDRAELQHFYNGLIATPSVLYNIQRTLQGVINYAVKMGIMPLSMLNIHKSLDRTASKEGVAHKHTLITKAERDYLWEHTDEETVKIILVYIYTGLRYAELRNLSEENIHEDYIEIVKAKTKAGERIVPLSDRVKSLLPISRVPIYSTFIKQFHQVLPNHKIHDTRHTFITMLTEAGVDQRIIKTIVGHSRKASVTDIYTHITLERMMEAVNLLVE